MKTLKIDKVPNRERNVYVYELLCENGATYVGRTGNLKKRLNQHIAGIGSKVTRKSLPVGLLRLDKYDSDESAMKAESKLKRSNTMTKTKKRKTRAGKAKRRRKTNPRVTYRRRKARWNANRPASYKRRRKRRRNPSWRGGYYKRGRLKRRRNPYMKKRRYAWRRRRNPGLRKALRMPSNKFFMDSLFGAFGVAIGYMGMGLYSRVLPAPMVESSRRFFGLGHILLGSIVFLSSKRSAGRTMGMTIAATGAYDLAARLLPDAGLPALPSNNALVDKVIPGKASGEGLSASFTPSRRLRANYDFPRSRMGRSYSPNTMKRTPNMGASFQVPALFGGTCSTPDGRM